MSSTKTYVKQIDGKWYAFAANYEDYQVFGIGRDCPPVSSGCYCYCAKWTDNGIKNVATPSPSRAAALKKARRHGEFGGEL